MARATPTGIERFFDEGELIVSKTDPTGRITYANRIFLEIAGYTEAEVHGRPHSIIRHPDMPRAVFSWMWTALRRGDELFAYVKNLCKEGDHYWVFAHVTPTWEDGACVGYHSSRRVPDRAAVDAIIPVYRRLCAIEAAAPDKASGLRASLTELRALLAAKEVSYDELVFAL